MLQNEKIHSILLLRMWQKFSNIEHFLQALYHQSPVTITYLKARAKIFIYQITHAKDKPIAIDI